MRFILDCKSLLKEHVAFAYQKDVYEALKMIYAFKY